MSAGLGVRLLDMLPRLAEVIGIELAYATQAAEIRRLTRIIPSKHNPAAQADVDRAVQKLVALVSKRVDIPRIRPQVEIKLGVEVPEESTRLSPVSERLLTLLKEHFPPVYEDRYLSGDLQRLAQLVLSGRFVEEAASVLPFEEGGV